MFRRLLLSIGLLGLLCAVAYAGLVAWESDGNDARQRYRFAEVEVGDVTDAVIATGTVMPVSSVLVGSQISGQLKELLVDFNTEVHKGDLIAIIDPVTFEIMVDQAAADVESAEAAIAVQQAAIERAQAELETAQANLEAANAQIQKAQVATTLAAQELERKRALVASGTATTAERDRAQAVLDDALAEARTAEAEQRSRSATIRAIAAQVRSAEAQLQAARAALKQKLAVLRQAQADLDRTQIRAPVDGVIIERSVDAGQTVAASLQAPTLFTIAQDLRDMQIELSVDEADVGRIRVDQEVVFTVDAFLGRSFTGKVVQIRKNPQVVQYVVTYTTIVAVPNPDLLLLPGMTANARVIVANRQSVLRVSNAALRYRPHGAPAANAPQVWVHGDNEPESVSVQVGISDGSYTEITGELQGGETVIVGEIVTPSESVTQRIFGAGL